MIVARRVLDANDYGFRKVIRVVLDDSLPEWVHPEDSGQAHRADLARGPTKLDGSRGDLDPRLAMATECHACRSNWEVEEFIFQDAAMQMTDQEMLDFIATRLDAKSGRVKSPMVDINGRPF